MSEDAFLAKLSTILEVDPDKLNAQFRLDYGNWDSLTVMATIAAIDEQFDLSVSPKELVACATVSDLLALTRTNSAGNQ